MKQDDILQKIFIILAVLLLGGCAQMRSMPSLTQTPEAPPVQSTVAPTKTPEPMPTQTPTAPAPSSAHEPTPIDCSRARFTFPQADDTVGTGAISILWEPSDCMMVLQYYQQEKLVEEFFDAHSGVTINIPKSGLTELKIWVPGASSPSDAIWISVK